MVERAAASPGYGRLLRCRPAIVACAFRCALADQEKRPRLADAPDGGRAAPLEHEPVGGELAERLADMDAARLAVRLHARGGVHSIAPDVVGEAGIADHARSRRPAVDADAQPEPAAAERRLPADEVNHCEAKARNGDGALLWAALETGRRHVAVSNGLDLFNPASLAQCIAGAHQAVEEAHDLLRRQVVSR